MSKKKRGKPNNPMSGTTVRTNSAEMQVNPANMQANPAEMQVNSIEQPANSMDMQANPTDMQNPFISAEESFVSADLQESSPDRAAFSEEMTDVLRADAAEKVSARENVSNGTADPIREVLKEHSFYAPRASLESDWDENEEAEEEEYNRASVNRLKKAILVALILMFLIPTILCLILLTQMHGMKEEIEQLREEMNSKRQERMLAEQQSEDMAGTAADISITLEKDRQDESVVLKNAGAAGTNQSDTEAAEDNTQEMSEASSEEDETEIDPASVPEEKRVYLTFDDGPSDDAGAILDVLKEKNVKATFFMVLEDKSRQAIIRRMAEEGHSLGIHSVSHVYSDIYADLDSFADDVTTVHDLLFEMTGQDVRLYRFPGGSSNRVSDVPVDDCIAWLEEEGYTYFDWNASNGDSSGSGYTAEQLEDNVLRYVHNNSEATVVLMHDFKDCPATAQSLPHLIDTLREEGYVLLPIDETTRPVHHRKTAKELEEEQEKEQAALEAEKARRAAMDAESQDDDETSQDEDE